MRIPLDHCTALIASAVSVLVVSTAFADGGLNNAWDNLYPTSNSSANAGCAVCHRSQGSPFDEWNTYGWAIKLNKDNGASDSMAISMAAAADSDADPTGTSNLGEIDLDTQPGWTDGPNNTIYFDNGDTLVNQMPASGIAGDLDPAVVCVGDIDNSGAVDVVDLLSLLGGWGACPDPCPPTCDADINGDCEVDVVDLLGLLGAWGDC